MQMHCWHTILGLTRPDIHLFQLQYLQYKTTVEFLCQHGIKQKIILYHKNINSNAAVMQLPREQQLDKYSWVLLQMQNDNRTTNALFQIIHIQPMKEDQWNATTFNILIGYSYKAGYRPKILFTISQHSFSYLQHICSSSRLV